MQPDITLGPTLNTARKQAARDILGASGKIKIVLDSTEDENSLRRKGPSTFKRLRTVGTYHVSPVGEHVENGAHSGKRGTHHGVHSRAQCGCDVFLLASLNFPVLYSASVLLL